MARSFVPPPKPAAADSRLPDEARLGRAMDASTSRQLIQLLVQAAAAGNKASRATMMAALDRQPAETRKPLLEDALSQTSTPKAREALEEALARTR